jgi:hypothetical protein
MHTLDFAFCFSAVVQASTDSEPPAYLRPADTGLQLRITSAETDRTACQSLRVWAATLLTYAAPPFFCSTVVHSYSELHAADKQQHVLEMESTDSCRESHTFGMAKGGVFRL